ncbi:helix-turn-helix domain-containing protein [Congregicoccus parvus]|uniref:helix-turn-helix domain-containing protein n=1 Tax=Congregicoccus parvus TaxID=3081749 RepID=UPI003FA59A30
MDTKSGEIEAGLWLRSLKSALHERGIGYAEVARELGVSLPTVKRLLNKPGLPFDRLVSLCRLAGLELSELAARVERERPRHYLFDDVQDRLFAERPEYMTYFVCLAEAGETPLEIEARVGLSRLSTERYLIGLERAGLLEREEELRVRLKVRPPFGFAPGSRVLRRRQARFMERVTARVSSGEAGRHFALMKPLRLAPALYREMTKDLLEVLDRYSLFSARTRPGDEMEDWSLAIAVAPSEAEHEVPIVEQSESWRV